VADGDVEVGQFHVRRVGTHYESAQRPCQQRSLSGAVPTPAGLAAAPRFTWNAARVAHLRAGRCAALCAPPAVAAVRNSPGTATVRSVARPATRAAEVAAITTTTGRTTHRTERSTPGDCPRAGGWSAEGRPLESSARNGVLGTNRLRPSGGRAAERRWCPPRRSRGIAVLRHRAHGQKARWSRVGTLGKQRARARPAVEGLWCGRRTPLTWVRASARLAPAPKRVPRETGRCRCALCPGAAGPDWRPRNARRTTGATPAHPGRRARHRQAWSRLHWAARVVPRETLCRRSTGRVQARTGDRGAPTAGRPGWRAALVPPMTPGARAGVSAQPTREADVSGGRRASGDNARRPAMRGLHAVRRRRHRLPAGTASGRDRAVGGRELGATSSRDARAAGARPEARCGARST
jgi:hypothetical protein